MSNFTLFTNENSASNVTSDYVQNVFDDVSLPATNNTGLTDTASTNPTGALLGNSDAMMFGLKTLYIKDLVYIPDRTKWILNRPTYRIIFTENYPAVEGYVWGAFKLTGGGAEGARIQFANVNDGIGITGKFRRVGFVWDHMQRMTNPTGTLTGSLFVDGSSAGTLTFTNLTAYPSELGLIKNTKKSGYYHAAANISTNDLHTVQLRADQAALAAGKPAMTIAALQVYFENSGANVAVGPGTTYVNKSNATTSAGATLPVPTYGSSFGGVGLLYKTQGGGYTFAPRSLTSIISIGQGTTGTNLMTVTTGTGASFSVGMGIYGSMGTSGYLGIVTNISTDTLTIYPTLGFGFTNTIQSCWRGGATTAISATTMQLWQTIDCRALNLSSSMGNTTTIQQAGQDWMLWGAPLSNPELTSAYYQRSNGLVFRANTAGGNLTVQGKFAACEFQFYGITQCILHGTFYVNGLPQLGINQGITGLNNYTIFTDGPEGWNTVQFLPGLSISVVSCAVDAINLYQNAPVYGVTTGLIAQMGRNTSFLDRGTTSSTTMPLGTHQRVYAAQLPMLGNWVGSQGTSFAGCWGFLGSTNNCSWRFDYYGKNVNIVGVHATGATLTVDGTGVGATFNSPITVASESWHSVIYQLNNGNTATIECIDYQATNGTAVSKQNFSPRKEITYTAQKMFEAARGPSVIRLLESAAKVGSVICYNQILEWSGTDLIYVSDQTVSGDFLQVVTDGLYFFSAGMDQNTAAGTGEIAIYKNASNNNSSGVPSVQSGYLAMSGGTASETGADVFSCSATTYCKSGDIIRFIGGNVLPSNSLLAWAMGVKIA